jgi:hypothetical protein
VSLHPTEWVWEGHSARPSHYAKGHWLVTVAGQRGGLRRLPHRLKTFAHRGLAGFDYSRRIAPQLPIQPWRQSRTLGPQDRAPLRPEAGELGCYAERPRPVARRHCGLDLGEFG